MVSVKVVECTRLPLVPVMVIVRVPRVALPLTCTDSVELPDPATGFGLKLVVTREPCPLVLRLTFPENPLIAPIVTVVVPVVPRVTVMLFGESEMEKSGFGAAFTTSVTVVECTRLPLVPVMVRV